MPRGRGHGRQRRVMSFLQPCLLVMLHHGEAHGYSLLNGLDKFGFDLNWLDSSLVYRALREMEATGLIISEWADESLGPQRRVYHITGPARRPWRNGRKTCATPARRLTICWPLMKKWHKPKAERRR